MKHVMSPSDIDVLLHCYVVPTKHPRADAPAVREAIYRFLQEDLIYQMDDGTYRTTKRGSAHVAQLCSIPFPTQAWVTSQGEIIK